MYNYNLHLYIYFLLNSPCNQVFLGAWDPRLFIRDFMALILKFASLECDKIIISVYYSSNFWDCSVSRNSEPPILKAKFFDTVRPIAPKEFELIFVHYKYSYTRSPRGLWNLQGKDMNQRQQLYGSWIDDWWQWWNEVCSPWLNGGQNCCSTLLEWASDLLALDGRFILRHILLNLEKYC